MYYPVFCNNPGLDHLSDRVSFYFFHLINHTWPRRLDCRCEMVTNCLSLGSLAKSAIWRRLFSSNWCRCGRCPACVTEKIDCRMTLIVMDKLSFTWTDQFCRYLSRVTTPRLMGREETLWTISVINTLCVETCLCSRFVLAYYTILLYF